jgi:hypothetical protein
MTRAKGSQYLRTFKKYIARCTSRRDRETIARCIKEVCILDHDFESAAFYRDRQRENAPRRRDICSTPRDGHRTAGSKGDAG